MALQVSDLKARQVALLDYFRYVVEKHPGKLKDEDWVRYYIAVIYFAVDNHPGNLPQFMTSCYQVISPINFKYFLLFAAIPAPVFVETFLRLTCWHGCSQQEAENLFKELIPVKDLKLTIVRGLLRNALNGGGQSQALTSIWNFHQELMIGRHIPLIIPFLSSNPVLHPLDSYHKVQTIKGVFEYLQARVGLSETFVVDTLQLVAVFKAFDVESLFFSTSGYGREQVGELINVMLNKICEGVGQYRSILRQLSTIFEPQYRRVPYAEIEKCFAHRIMAGRCEEVGLSPGQKGFESFDQARFLRKHARVALLNILRAPASSQLSFLPIELRFEIAKHYLQEMSHELGLSWPDEMVDIALADAKNDLMLHDNKDNYLKFTISRLQMLMQANKEPAQELTFFQLQKLVKHMVTVSCNEVPATEMHPFFMSLRQTYVLGLFATAAQSNTEKWLGLLEKLAQAFLEGIKVHVASRETHCLLDSDYFDYFELFSKIDDLLSKSIFGDIFCDTFTKGNLYKYEWRLKFSSLLELGCFREIYCLRADSATRVNSDCFRALTVIDAYTARCGLQQFPQQVQHLLVKINAEVGVQLEASKSSGSFRSFGSFGSFDEFKKNIAWEFYYSQLYYSLQDLAPQQLSTNAELAELRSHVLLHRFLFQPSLVMNEDAVEAQSVDNSLHK